MFPQKKHSRIVFPSIICFKLNLKVKETVAFAVMSNVQVN